MECGRQETWPEQGGSQRPASQCLSLRKKPKTLTSCMFLSSHSSVLKNGLASCGTAAECMRPSGLAWLPGTLLYLQTPRSPLEKVA